MSTTKKLRLGPLPETESLIPHMLEAFMAGNRGFRRGRGDR